ncbi:MAG: tRNA-dependent cyclodipeptide synthase [Planctomycetota bacterium]|jgi:tRNA-dependent cyclodipeptide synthase
MTLESKLENHNLPKVSLVKITPKISEQELFSYKKCYMGISLANPVFQGKPLEALLSWMIDRFEMSLVVVGDYLWRFNEQIFSGLDSAQAEESANALGDSFIEKTNELFDNLPSEKVNLTRWESHLSTAEFLRSKNELEHLFESDPDFHSSVERDAFSFVRRQAKQSKKFAVETERAIELSSQYLLEEIAVFSALAEQGWHVELYPGPELRVLVDIVKGKYQNIPKGLKERINVELRVDEEVAY